MATSLHKSNAFDSRVSMVASNIRQLRQYRNYSQEYLAAKLEISQNAYSKIERRITDLSIKRLIQIAIILDVELSELLTGPIKQPN